MAAASSCEAGRESSLVQHWLQPLQCCIARDVIFVTVRVDNAANREVVQGFDQLANSVSAACIYHETVNPVGSSKVKASAGHRAGQAKFSYFTDLFDLYHESNHAIGR
jgi:hypothetical protein